MKKRKIFITIFVIFMIFSFSLSFILKIDKFKYFSCEPINIEYNVSKEDTLIIKDLKRKEIILNTTISGEGTFRIENCLLEGDYIIFLKNANTFLEFKVISNPFQPELIIFLFFNIFLPFILSLFFSLFRPLTNFAKFIENLISNEIYGKKLEGGILHDFFKLFLSKLEIIIALGLLFGVIFNMTTLFNIIYHPIQRLNKLIFEFFKYPFLLSIENVLSFILTIFMWVFVITIAISLIYFIFNLLSKIKR